MYKKLSIFTLVTVAVIIAAAIFASMRAPQTAKEKPLFFPELKQSIENVSHIEIKSFDDTINLVRDKNTWGIAEFDGYPALPDKVKSTVLGTADLKLNAPKTALKRLYPRLGVEGPIADESTSKLLEKVALLWAGNARAGGGPPFPALLQAGQPGGLAQSAGRGTP